MESNDLAGVPVCWNRAAGNRPPHEINFWGVASLKNECLPSQSARREPLRRALHVVQRIQQGEGGDVWFALDHTRPLAVFAGLWTNWTSVRKVKEGETTNDVFAFLTTDTNDIVGPIHPKAMPVILTTDQIEEWMTGTQEEALTLQRSVPNGALNIVAKGKKEDSAG